jgi:sigma-B regulation protein RsbU (phosphoserine phosphatase)
LFLISSTYFARNALLTLALVQHADKYVQPPFDLGDANWGAVGVGPAAEAAGMKFGDTVLSVNGHPIDGFITYYGAIREARPGDRLRVQIRGPRPDISPARDLSIQLRSFSDLSPDLRNPDLSTYIGILLPMVVLPIVCIALGFWVAAVRISDRSAWLVLVVLLSFAASSVGGNSLILFGSQNIFQPLLAMFPAFFGIIAAAALMLFGIAFPERLEFDRRYPWLKWIVAGHLILVSVLAAVGLGLWGNHVELARRFIAPPLERLTGVEGNFGSLSRAAALLICAVSLGWKTITAPSRDARRRLLLLDMGAIPSIAALLTLLIVFTFDRTLPVWSRYLLTPMELAFPFTMAYVIVVHRAMDVRVVIRQGLQYVLARGGIRAIQIMLLVALSAGAASLLSGGAGLDRVALVVAGMVIIVAMSGRFADRLRGCVDRRFFREAYETDAILSDLASQVRTIVETRPLLETVATRIGKSLHVPRVAILLDGGRAFQPAYVLGYPAPPDVSIPLEGVTAKRLRKQQHAIVEFDNENSWVQLVDDGEREALQQLKSELLLPLSLNEKVLGIMSLGPKQSEEPFSRTDIRLLDSVAAQTGLALENGRLTAVIASEAAEREKQKRELEIAHDVQERLFPQEYPPVEGLDYAGACRPALGVGGDYYDFILLSPTELGIAIGDISGKGIPAALLMATLRAYLRGLTSNRQTELPDVIARLNNLVLESSASNRYATFFYAEYDSVTRVLKYVNGGHNPPMLFKTSGSGKHVLGLEIGGPVIGLMPDCTYEQGSATLEPGDVLVAYTDGVSEALNTADAEWGEDRLRETVHPNRTVPAHDLIGRIVKAADEFADGAPQHDDMTLIVIRAI